eukprot:321267-Rhodomonas_salina.1
MQSARASSVRWRSISLRPRYAMSGTDIAYAAIISLRARYAMSGPDTAYATIISLGARYAVPGTDLANGATRSEELRLRQTRQRWYQELYKQLPIGMIGVGAPIAEEGAEEDKEEEEGEEGEEEYRDEFEEEEQEEEGEEGEGEGETGGVQVEEASAGGEGAPMKRYRLRHPYRATHRLCNVRCGGEPRRRRSGSLSPFAPATACPVLTRSVVQMKVVVEGREGAPESQAVKAGAKREEVRRRVLSGVGVQRGLKWVWLM